MKYLTLLTAAIAIMFTASAKTLEEVKAEYKDGTTVYNFRYKTRVLYFKSNPIYCLQALHLI